MCLFLGANAQDLAMWQGAAHFDEEEKIEAADSIDDESELFKEINWWDFDTALIPCHDSYCYSWDSLNVDGPRLSNLDSILGVTIALTEHDCGYVHPCSGKINSDFGWRSYRMHNGIDIDLETGDPICAAFDGVVRIAKYNYGGYGNYVMIRHYNGLETLYGHLSDRFVFPNQTVRAGDIIGLGGSTGRSSGPHLHFEVRYKGIPIDPNKIIEFDSNALRMDSVYLSLSDFSPPHPSKMASPRSTSSKVYHKVRSGDTLWAISRRHGTTVSRICRLNGINENKALRVGQTLRIR
ncbi:MAG: murein DD-endopeptidase MepM/ murein hydrolase activator NlpD [Bacteroidia bacterium]|jgi:murein DD-endopeptidase MepM/ murein hydrolase activator NlpD